MSSPLVYDTPSRGTPARQRADLGSVRKAPQVDLNSEPVSVCNIKVSAGVVCVGKVLYSWFGPNNVFEFASRLQTGP